MLSLGAKLSGASKKAFRHFVLNGGGRIAHEDDNKFGPRRFQLKFVHSTQARPCRSCCQMRSISNGERAAEASRRALLPAAACSGCCSGCLCRSRGRCAARRDGPGIHHATHPAAGSAQSSRSDRCIARLHIRHVAQRERRPAQGHALPRQSRPDGEGRRRPRVRLARCDAVHLRLVQQWRWDEPELGRQLPGTHRTSRRRSARRVSTRPGSSRSSRATRRR